MRKMLLGSAIAIVLAAPGFAAGNGSQPDQTANNALQSRVSGDRNARLSDWIQVTSAENLVGRDVRSKDGKNAGEIDGLVLDLPQGEVVYALIGSGGDLDIGSDRIAVPFGVLETPFPADEDAALTINQDLSKLRTGTRLTEDRFSDLGNQTTMKQVYGAYGIALPSGYVVPPSPNRNQHPYRYVLVRPDNLTMLGNASQARAQDVRGTEVRHSNGDEIGEIDQIMIDPSSGRIPYLLLSSGGFLGIGNDWLPVPPQAVSWSPDKDAFVLKDKDLKPAAVQALHRTNLPAHVQRAQLQTLYERFNLTPYWENQATQKQG